METYHYKTSGLDDVVLLNGFEIITYGDEKAIAIHDLDGLHQVIALSLVDQAAMLSGREFRFLRIELDLSQKAIAALFEISDQTIANYEKEDRVPKWADVLMRALYVESLGKDSEIRKMLEKLSKVDREIHRMQFEFEEL